MRSCKNRSMRFLSREGTTETLLVLRKARAGVYTTWLEVKGETKQFFHCWRNTVIQLGAAASLVSITRQQHTAPFTVARISRGEPAGKMSRSPWWRSGILQDGHVAHQTWWQHYTEYVIFPAHRVSCLKHQCWIESRQQESPSIVLWGG